MTSLNTNRTNVQRVFRFNAFLGLVTILLLPLIVVVWNSVQTARFAALRGQCASHLSTLGSKLIVYEERFGRFPADVKSPAGVPLLSWRVELLQELDPELYNQFDLTQAWNSNANLALLHPMPAWYGCPADKQAKLNGITSYFSVCTPRNSESSGTFYSFQLDTAVDHLDCILLLESAALRIPWTCPGDFPGDPCDPAKLNTAFTASACERPHAPYVIHVNGRRVGLGP